MSQFYNPIFLGKVMKTYIYDIDRLWYLDQNGLEKFQNKQIRRMINFAYTVPLYHDKYKKAGICPDDIKTKKDLEKLPIVSKKDFVKYYPDGIVSSKVNKAKLIHVSTSGTTGKSLSIYVDMFDIVAGLFGYIRSLREHGINWRKDRLTIIADFAPHTVETGYISKGLEPSLSSNFFFKNIQWLNTNDPPEEVVKKVDKFNPDFLGGYTGMIGHLALLKEKGKAKNISPKVVATTGAPLDRSLKSLIQKTFNASVFESYGSTESGPIAFQCKNGSYHIMSDLVIPEYLKLNKNISGDVGKLVITKLYGKGTPIIRYDAINDIIEPDRSICNCGMSGELVKKIYGRDDIALYSSDGRILLPSSFGEVFGRILYELKTNKLKDVRIIQHSINNLEVKAVIDKSSKKPSSEEIFSVIKSGFEEKLGKDVNIVFKQVKKIDRSKPRIISKVDVRQFSTLRYD